MILWSIQSRAAWRVLQRDGVLRAIHAHRPACFAEAYAWMEGQMHQRIGPPPKSGCSPLWAWHAWDGTRRRRPDLRARGHVEPGTASMRLEIELPDDEVLLSDFDEWHCVLNRGYLARSGREHAAFEARCKRRLARGPRAAQARVVDGWMRASWTRIFEANHPNTQPSRRSVQATFWELPLAAVRRSQPFVGR